MTRSFFARALAAPILAAVAPVASADQLEDRYMEAQAGFEKRLNAFYVSRVPEMAGKIPQFMEDPRAREAILCGFDYIRENAGEAGAEELVTWVEGMASSPVESFDDLSAAPEGRVGDVMMEAVQACESIAITQELMEASGMMEMFRDPEVLGRLMDDGS
ncbi:MAG: hypothetical protein AAFP13_05630 [Pseudomonadota bacterium]